MITEAKNKAINQPTVTSTVTYSYPEAGRSFTGVDKEDCDKQFAEFMAPKEETK